MATIHSKTSLSRSAKMRRDAIAYFNRVKAQVKAEDVDKIRKVLRYKKKGPLANIWGKVSDLWAVANDKDIAFAQKAGPIAALLYVVMPIDLIPDAFPFAGLIDDAAVVGYVVSTLAAKISPGKKPKANPK
ncbi:YkvA family protein [Geofilum rubicundum]|uniref:DUF1232 domain-containing protein n=1 Tax=Geofilum rubicundum JCM 15548 TaxID=1236989 RepID=A0A0E9M1B6_9BACT|nr:YkvA family protein [Geofilum rubicundum]GAO31274.1 hypothetical protein JCM15548_13622 [Geofilum rubicundum JCM 15548]